MIGAPSLCPEPEATELPSVAGGVVPPDEGLPEVDGSVEGALGRGDGAIAPGIPGGVLAG
jgi:hypothetical protein